MSLKSTICKRALLCVLLFTALSCGENLSQDQVSKGRRIRFTYNVSIPLSEPPANRIDVWIPMPPSTVNQKLHSYDIASELRHEIFTDPMFGNKILHLFGDHSESDQNITLTCELTRYEAGRAKVDSLADPSSGFDSPDNFLAASKLVPIDGVIAAEADTVTDKSGTTMQNARALYDHLLQTMQYDKSGVGWGQGDALYACDVRKGNCTDIHSLFIGMARACSIPARFVIGFPLPADRTRGEVGGYHCWAEFYEADSGWVPVDISEAIKHPEKKEQLFGHLDPDRIEFTRGREIPILVQTDTIHLNYMVYPLVLINGQPTDEFEKKFSFENL